jgi:hypothetical protein
MEDEVKTHFFVIIDEGYLVEYLGELKMSMIGESCRSFVRRR